MTMTENENKSGACTSASACFRTATSTGAPQGLGSKTPKQGQKMIGAQAVVASLEAEGVDLVFGYPGGQAIKLYDALFDSTQIKHVLARHEQAAVFEANGYARATGKVGVAMVTSGPGATNTVTGLADAYMDSIPVIVICGQVPLGVIGTDSFQESDITGITMPIVKHSYFLQSTDELTKVFREAFYIAITGRPGPVLIDVPSDVASEEMVFEYPDEVNLASYKPTYRGNAKQIRNAAQLIAQATQPVLYAGGGVISSDASEELVELADLTQIPVVTTLLGKGGFPASHPLNLGPVGMHGAKYSNLAMTESDLIIACGARFSDRVTGKSSLFAPHAKIIHIDIDPAEIGKIRAAQVPIVGDLKGVLRGLNEVIKSEQIRPDTEAWLKRIEGWRFRFPYYHENVGDSPDEIIPEVVMTELSDALDPDSSIVVTEVGQHQMWAAQFIAREKPRTFLSSGGLGAMGFGLPAAIGAAFAKPECSVVCVAGDGSLQMNIQELATATIHHIPVKVLLLNNRCLGMVHQWQKLFYNERYSATLLDAVPDFVKLAEAYSWKAARVERPEEVKDAIDKMLATEGPYLLEVVISQEQNVFPMVAPGAALADSLGAIDVAIGAVRTDLPASVDRSGITSPCANIDAQFGGRWQIGKDDVAPRVGQAGGYATEEEALAAEVAKRSGAAEQSQPLSEGGQS